MRRLAMMRANASAETGTAGRGTGRGIGHGLMLWRTFYDVAINIRKQRVAGNDVRVMSGRAPLLFREYDSSLAAHLYFGIHTAVSIPYETLHAPPSSCAGRMWRCGFLLTPLALVGCPSFF